jgi:hypothetical protein
MKVSFCTACHNRMWQKTAFETSLVVAADWKDVEFILIDYGSSDGLGHWIANLPWVARKNLRCFRMEADGYRAPHAKNVSHCTASGDILVNLDFDNFLAIGYADAVRQVVRDGVILHNLTEGYPGTYGRIALTRHDFLSLRGYDESFAPMRYQDADLLRRARARGMTVTRGGMPSSCIHNGPPTEQHLKWHLENQLKGENAHRIVNPGGFGRAILAENPG